MFNSMKLGLTLIALVLVTGCAGNQAARDYYMAVQSSANAKAQADTARYAALAKMAGNGGEASVAATMAIALTQPTAITPQYIEGDALKWAGVLAAPVTTLGLGLVQAGVSKNASDNAASIQMASFASQEAIQLGQQSMVTGLGSQWATAGVASADIAIAGFSALNTAGDQTVTTALAGLDATTTVASVGLTTADSIAGAGFTQIGLTAEDGINATANVGIAGMGALNELGQYGMATVSTVGIAGMNSIEAVGIAGMTGIETVGIAGMTGIETVGLAGMTDLTSLGTVGIDAVSAQGTNYTAIIADMQKTIDAMAIEIGTPITCNDNGSGSYTCQ